ncbi:MAG: hypothetical protein V3T17_01120 [Pseudomonadales bacterium]
MSERESKTTAERLSEFVGRLSGVKDLVHVRMSFVRNSGDPASSHCCSGYGGFGKVFSEARKKNWQEVGQGNSSEETREQSDESHAVSNTAEWVERSALTERKWS